MLATLFLAITLAIPVQASAPQTPPAASPVVVPIWPEGVPGAIAGAAPEVSENGLVSNVHQPSLTVHLAPTASANGTAVVVCPGGGYARLAFDKEGTAVARWLNGLGISAFVLKYRLKEYGHPAPLRDVLRAIRLVRSRAAEWHVNPDRIGVAGFSAGGHLASSAATLFDAPEGKTGAALDAVSARPDFAILVYPVITLKPPFAHMGSRENLVGKTPAADMVDHMSTDLQVTPRTPPTFLVHGGTDTAVPLENSLLFYSALRRAGVPGELHVFQAGPHGFGLNPGFGPISDWPARCADWLKVRGLAN
jgi:acetyl esterase/lipase